MKNKKKLVLSIFVCILLSITFLVIRRNTIENKKNINDKKKFNEIIKLNRLLIDSIPDTVIINYRYNYHHSYSYQRKAYADFFSKKQFVTIENKLGNGTLIDIWGNPKTGIVYTYKIEPLFLKDQRVFVYLFYEGDYRKSDRYDKISAVKIESKSNLGSGWYKFVYMEYTGLHMH